MSNSRCPQGQSVTMGPATALLPLLVHSDLTTSFIRVCFLFFLPVLSLVSMSLPSVCWIVWAVLPNCLKFDFNFIRQNTNKYTTTNSCVCVHAHTYTSLMKYLGYWIFSSHTQTVPCWVWITRCVCVCVCLHLFWWSGCFSPTHQLMLHQ